MLLIEFCSRKVVNPETAFADQSVNLVYASLPAIVEFQGRPSTKPAGCNRKYECLKSWRIVRIEWAIDEDIITRSGAVRQDLFLHAVEFFDYRPNLLDRNRPALFRVGSQNIESRCGATAESWRSLGRGGGC